MDNAIVIYSSKYGSAKKYAKWISEEINCEVYDLKEFKSKTLARYDTVIFGGGLYAGRIRGFKFIAKNYENIKNKNVVVYSVGLTKPDDEKRIEEIKNTNLTEDMKKDITYFHFGGALDYSNLVFLHKSMLSMMSKMISKAKDASEADKAFIENLEKKIDYTDKLALIPLINYVKKSKKEV